jgi:hypothetical protein
MPEWVLPLASILILIFTALVGVIWKLLNDRIDAIKRMLLERIEALWDQIGRDSHSGMRKTTHDAHSLATQHVSLIGAIVERVKRLEERFDAWRNRRP